MTCWICCHHLKVLYSAGVGLFLHDRKTRVTVSVAELLVYTGVYWCLRVFYLVFCFDCDKSVYEGMSDHSSEYTKKYFTCQRHCH